MRGGQLKRELGDEGWELGDKGGGAGRRGGGSWETGDVRQNSLGRWKKGELEMGDTGVRDRRHNPSVHPSYIFNMIAIVFNKT